MRSGRWDTLTTVDFGALDPERTVALLPVAAVEQHGPHLPLATDALINAGIAERALALAGEDPALLLLPAMNVGASLEHREFAGTLDIAAETLLAAWLDVGRSVVRSGVRKLVIFNSHGGQAALVDLAALRLRAEARMLVARASYFAFGAPRGLFEADELAHGLHGGEVETSLLLHLAPRLVRRDALRDFASRSRELARDNALLGAESPVGVGWMSQDLNPAGVCGNAAAADAARGAALLEHLAERLLLLVRELADTPLATLADGPRR